jgi:ribonuclease HI
MRDSGLTPAAVVLDARQQRFVVRLASGCHGSKSKKLFEHPSPGAPVGSVAAIEHACGRSAETMRGPDPREKPAVKTTILEADTEAKRGAELWAKEKEGKSGSGTWKWGTDGWRTNNERVGAAAVCLNGVGWTIFRSYLGTGQMEVFDAEQWAIGVALRKSVAKAEGLRACGVATVAVFSDSQAAIRRTAHLDAGPGQKLARAINEHAWALHAQGIDVVNHWVPGHSGICGNEEADRQANKAKKGHWYTVGERIYSSAANIARRISEGRTVAKAKWEAERCSNQYGNRLNGKAGSKRSVPMTSVKPLDARFSRLKCGHAPTGAYLKRFGHREDDIGWCCREGAVQTREHLFRHCSRLKDQQTTLWKTVGKATS